MAGLLLAAVVDVPLALAFGAGMVAAVNPCGFAMLPAYLSYFCGLDGGDRAGSVAGGDRAGSVAGGDRAGSVAGLRIVPRALSVTAVMTAGFIAVFGLVGLAVTQLSSSILDHAKWATIVIGLGLVVLGGALLAGRELTVRLPHLERGGTGRELGSMLLFGISYAVASLSCTLPAFLATTSSTFSRSGTLAGLVTFVVYGLGMGLIVGALTLAVALARAGVVSALRRMVRHVSRASGALVVVAGLYVTYYGWYEVRLDRLRPGDDPADPVVDRALRIQQALSNWAYDVGTLRLGLACAVVVVGALALTWLLRHGREAGGPAVAAPSAPSAAPAGAPAGAAPAGDTTNTTDATTDDRATSVR